MIKLLWHFGQVISILPLPFGTLTTVLQLGQLKNLCVFLSFHILFCKANFESNLALQRKRYEEIRDGAEFYAQEDVVPTRDDMAVVFSFLRKEYQLKHTYFPIRRLLGMLNNIQNFKIGFIKLEMIIRIMQELHLCEILEPVEDCFIFDFYFQPTKTSIEKSSVLKKLKTQLHR